MIWFLFSPFLAFLGMGTDSDDTSKKMWSFGLMLLIGLVLFVLVIWALAAAGFFSAVIEFYKHCLDAAIKLLPLAIL